MQPHPTLVTHSGKFHADDVLAYAILRAALALQTPGHDHTLLRTRDPAPIAAATIAWDVGSVFDPHAQRFDHHQRGAPLRPDGTPFSSAGLVWQVHGTQAVTNLLDDPTHAPAIAAELDRTLIHRIDELDNGVSANGPVRDDPLGLAALIGEFNPTWDSPDAQGPNAGDTAFQAAAAFATATLHRRIDALRARHAADAIVLAAHQAGPDPRLLLLDQGMPWKGAVFAHGLPVLYTISPASNGNWMVDAMPPEPGSFAQRLPLPEAWAGLQGPDLEAATGIPGAVFVHLRRFVAAAKTRQAALAMAQLALDQHPA